MSLYFTRRNHIQFSKVLLLTILAWQTILNPSSVAAQASNGSELFSQKCAGCHTIGGGEGVGPDLVQTKDWTDDKLKAGVEKMAAMAGSLSPEQVTTLVNYLKNPGSNAVGQNTEQKPTSTTGPKESEEIELPGSFEEGKMLFMGSKQFENGGMSCIACHQSGNSGGLGPNLQNINSKLKGRALVAACKQTPYKIMRAAYKEHPITEAEALNLAKYLSTEDKEKRAEADQPIIPMAGGAIALTFLGLLAFGYRNRNKSVRDKLKRK